MILPSVPARGVSRVRSVHMSQHESKYPDGDTYLPDPSGDGLNAVMTVALKS